MLSLPTTLLFIVLILGLVRFVAPLGDVWARRWGYTAAILLGMRAAWGLCLGVLPLVGVELRSLGNALFVVSSFVTAASLVAMLLAMEKGSLALDVHPPWGLIRFAVGAAVLQWIGYLVFRAFLDSSGVAKPGALLVNELLPVLHFLAHVLLVGVFGVTLAALERKRDTAAAGSGWTPAAEGLGLYIKGLYVRIALLILSAGLSALLSAWRAYRAFNRDVQGVLVLVGLVFTGMMLVGLVRYASLPEMAGARGHVYASLVLLLSAEKMALTPYYPLTVYAVYALLPVSLIVLSNSFRRVALELQDGELAQAVRQVMFWFFVLGSVVAGLGRRMGAPEFISFVAVVCVLVGLVRFFLVLGQVRRRMVEGVASASQPVALFSAV
ncbi:MAG TPA: hypothetical protein VE057_27265 [Archangium sp.]|nr:hypothetical protein [Archangium sp.]